MTTRRKILEIHEKGSVGRLPYPGRRVPDRHPCDVCKRVHPGRCVPADVRSVHVNLTLPGRVHRRMVERVPWGQRSGWIARLVAQELDR